MIHNANDCMDSVVGWTRSSFLMKFSSLKVEPDEIWGVVDAVGVEVDDDDDPDWSLAPFLFTLLLISVVDDILFCLIQFVSCVCVFG